MMQVARVFLIILILSIPGLCEAEVFDLYVAEFRTGEILEVTCSVDAQGIPTVVGEPRLFASGLTSPVELALDGLGTLYVGAFSAGTDPVSEITLFRDSSGDGRPDPSAREDVATTLADIDGFTLPFDVYGAAASRFWASSFGGSAIQPVLLFETMVAGRFPAPAEIPGDAADVPIGQAITLASNGIGDLYLMDNAIGMIRILVDCDGNGVVSSEDPALYNDPGAGRLHGVAMDFDAAGCLFVVDANPADTSAGRILVFRDEVSALSLGPVEPALFASGVPVVYSPAAGMAMAPTNPSTGLVLLTDFQGKRILAMRDLDHDLAADDAEPMVLLTGLDGPSAIAVPPFDYRERDGDGDGVADAVDNCLRAVNPGQEDIDGDRVGDACDEGLCGTFASPSGPGSQAGGLAVFAGFLGLVLLRILIGRVALRRSSFFATLFLAAALAASLPGRAAALEYDLYGLPDYSITIDADYRSRVYWINPLEVNGLVADEVGIADQRMRLDLGLSYKGLVSVRSQFDLLDGVLFGDNGFWGSVSTSEFGVPILPNEGIKTSAIIPNDGRVGIGFLSPDLPPVSSDSYGPVLLEAETFEINRIWGEVMLPIGLLRVGRQPATIGRSILANDGTARMNDFGVSKYGDTVDRILLGTKPLEIAKVIRAGFDRSVANSSMDEGLITVIAYDFVALNDIAAAGDDVKMLVAASFFRKPRFTFLGAEGSDLEVAFTFGYRWGGVYYKYTTEEEGFVDGVWRSWTARHREHLDIVVPSLSARLGFGMAGFHFDCEVVTIPTGHTEEVGKTINETSPNFFPTDRLKVRQLGMQANLAYEKGPFTFALEFDYASGDSDPKDGVLEEFMFAEDTNVGMLLFEEVIAFKRAQSAAAGTWSLLNSYAGIDRQPPSIPSTRIATMGAFSNAIALMPKVTWRPKKDLALRGGVLAAWAEEDVIDPTPLRLLEGNPKQNFNGGAPGDFYGIEWMGRAEYMLHDHFVFVLEGAYLMPGDALEDENGVAVDSYMVECRFHFLF